MENSDWVSPGAYTFSDLPFVFGLSGVSMCIDSACSSCSVAFTLATQHIRTGLLFGAFVGGAQFYCSVYTNIPIVRDLESPSGHCKVFDYRADGYSRSEGCGVLLLQRSADSRVEGAVVCGAGYNNCGFTVSRGAPNQAATVRLLERLLQVRRCMRKGALIDFLEANRYKVV